MDTSHEREDTAADAKLLSIIVPIYNAEAYLRDRINSLLAQDLDADRYEIL